jgi:hypothetical protein
MANELSTVAKTGSSVYCTLKSSSAKLWSTSANRFVSDMRPTDSNYDGEYNIPLSEQGSTGLFLGDMPSGLASDTLTIEFFSGSSGVLYDAFIRGGTFNWTGSGAVSQIASALTSLPFVKNYGQITGLTRDTFLLGRIISISAAIESYCRREFSLQAYVETIDGPGSTELLLPQWPVASATQVVANFNSANPVTIPGDNLIVNTKSGIVSVKPTSSLCQWFGYSNQGVQITYAAGYSPIPSDVQEICAAAVMLQYNKIGQDSSLSQEQIGDYRRVSRPDAQQLLTDDMKATLRRYRQAL